MTSVPEIRWLHSYVTDDKLYCVYVAPDEDILYEHARCGGFPANKVSQGLGGDRSVHRRLRPRLRTRPDHSHLPGITDP